jgi:putative Mg2+ transporter-C (MgtC) family protein
MLTGLDLTYIVQLLTATACGAALGWEREAQHKAAGLRTHMLVSLGAATFTAVGTALARMDGSEGDVTRVIQGVSAGIGFLGAGQILQNKDRIRGLTTAANIWLVGAVGVACGVGEYVIAVVAVALGLTTLSLVRKIEEKLVD